MKDGARGTLLFSLGEVLLKFDPNLFESRGHKSADGQSAME